MLVIEKAKALVLKLGDPSRVLDALPSAKQMKFDGVDYVVVPHKLDETRVLRNLGINAPAPILHGYKWRGRYTPYSHQKTTSAFITMHKKSLVLNAIGTGKSLSALWAADWMMTRGLVRKVLILSPLSTLERVWGDAVFTSFTNRKSVTLHGTAERRRKLLQTDADFYICNHDGFAIIAQDAKDMFDFTIIDEAAVLRNPQTTRFKTVRKFIDAHPNMRVCLMTGTPTPNSPEDAWALARLVGNPDLKDTYSGFRDKVMLKAGQWKYLPRPNSPEIVADILQPSIRFTRDECLDLPDTVFSTRKVELTKEQDKAYKEMVKNLIIEAQSGQITAANEAVKRMKLLQICLGVMYDDQGNWVELDCSTRVDAVREVIEEAGEKVIVFVPLTGALHMLERELSKHYSVAIVNGEVSAAKRNEIFRAFQNDKDPMVLLAHQGTMSHGLTLTAASTIIWFGPPNSNDQYEQSNGRIERIGKRYVGNVIHIEATALERGVFARLQSKQSLQGLILDLIAGEI